MVKWQGYRLVRLSMVHGKELVSHARGEVGSRGSELSGQSGDDRKPWNSQLMVPMLIFLASVLSVVDDGKQLATRGYVSRVIVIGLWVGASRLLRHLKLCEKEKGFAFEALRIG
ncbi:hypothetical protein NE237_004333 [Protea cynaroides]|uniref:Uncharacterized protein n=1 Tax=Protea cynaroides TaxID=273540 RepID=A0A9Q0QTL0_9MAGN|nr:hypothetical protein NE237_004333 [Protea cynaroides]